MPWLDINSGEKEGKAVQEISDSRGKFNSEFDLMNYNNPISSKDVVGLNVNEVDNIQQAINSYINKIDTVIGEMKTELRSSEIFANEDVRVAIDTYVEKMRQYVSSVLNGLQEFNTSIGEVRAYYIAQKASNVVHFENNSKAFDSVVSGATGSNGN